MAAPVNSILNSILIPNSAGGSTLLLVVPTNTSTASTLQSSQQFIPPTHRKFCTEINCPQYSGFVDGKCLDHSATAEGVIRRQGTHAENFTSPPIEDTHSTAISTTAQAGMTDQNKDLRDVSSIKNSRKSTQFGSSKTSSKTRNALVYDVCTEPGCTTSSRTILGKCVKHLKEFGGRERLDLSITDFIREGESATSKSSDIDYFHESESSSPQSPLASFSKRWINCRTDVANILREAYEALGDPSHLSSNSALDIAGLNCDLGVLLRLNRINMEIRQDDKLVEFGGSVVREVCFSGVTGTTGLKRRRSEFVGAELRLKITYPNLISESSVNARITVDYSDLSSTIFKHPFSLICSVGRPPLSSDAKSTLNIDASPGENSFDFGFASQSNQMECDDSVDNVYLLFILKVPWKKMLVHYIEACAKPESLLIERETVEQYQKKEELLEQLRSKRNGEDCIELTADGSKGRVSYFVSRTILESLCNLGSTTVKLPSTYYCAVDLEVLEIFITALHQGSVPILRNPLQIFALADLADQLYCDTLRCYCEAKAVTVMMLTDYELWRERVTNILYQSALCKGVLRIISRDRGVFRGHHLFMGKLKSVGEMLMEQHEEREYRILEAIVEGVAKGKCRIDKQSTESNKEITADGFEEDSTKACKSFHMKESRNDGPNQNSTSVVPKKRRKRRTRAELEEARRNGTLKLRKTKVEENSTVAGDVDFFNADEHPAIKEEPQEGPVSASVQDHGFSHQSLPSEGSFSEYYSRQYSEDIPAKVEDDELMQLLKNSFAVHASRLHHPVTCQEKVASEYEDIPQFAENDSLDEEMDDYDQSESVEPNQGSPSVQGSVCPSQNVIDVPKRRRRRRTRKEMEEAERNGTIRPRTNLRRREPPVIEAGRKRRRRRTRAEMAEAERLGLPKKLRKPKTPFDISAPDLPPSFTNEPKRPLDNYGPDLPPSFSDVPTGLPTLEGNKEEPASFEDPTVPFSVTNTLAMDTGRVDEELPVTKPVWNPRSKRKRIYERPFQISTKDVSKIIQDWVRTDLTLEEKRMVVRVHRHDVAGFRPFTLAPSALETVEGLKTMIFGFLGLPDGTKIKLVFGGVVLEEGRLLRSYGIVCNTIVTADCGGVEGR